MTTPAMREFEVFRRGEIRDLILDHFRAGCRGLVNPETGELFTEDEIASATAEGSRYWNEATAIDDMAQGDQRKALWLSDQLQIDRASSAWLKDYHAKQWDPDGKLPATPGSGVARVSGTPGTVIIGSTEIPDETAYWGRTAKGVRVQVFGTYSIPVNAEYVDVVMIAMDPGASTNPENGEIIEWSYRDPSMSPQATVTADWTGGTDIETDAAWVSRMIGNIRHKQGGGNDAQQRAWARSASNAVEDVFVYGCAFGYGSFLLVPVQKRGSSTAPTARMPSFAVLSAVTAYMVPPGSPENPSPPRCLVLPWVEQKTNLDIRLSLQRGSASGWEDALPFPDISDGPPSTRCLIDSFVGDTQADLYAPAVATLPGQAAEATLTGANCPKMMFWHEETSSWRTLTNVVSITQLPSLDYFRITFTARPALLAIGAAISPSIVSGLRPIVSKAITDYMDERGPGELYNLTTHYLGTRCVRFPEQAEANSSRVGNEVATRIVDDLFGAAADADLVYVSRTTPDVPVAPGLGPNMLTLGNVGIYPL